MLILIALLWIKVGGLKFYFVLWSSVFFHYAAILVVAYVLFYKQFRERKYISGVLILLMSLMVMYGAITMFGDVIIAKYSQYLQGDFAVKRDFRIGLLLLIFLYLGLGLTLLKQSTLDFIFFVLPLVVIKYFALDYPIMGRLESFILPMLMLVLTKDVIKSWRRDISSVIIVILSIINVYGVLSGLSIGRDGVFDAVHSASPFIPYHTFWGIK